MSSFAENGPAIQKNGVGHFVQPHTDNTILTQKGLKGYSDKECAANFNWSVDRYKIELENLVFRHIKCNFSTKESLMMQLRISEADIDRMMKNAEMREIGFNHIPQDVSLLKAQVAQMQLQMKIIEGMLVSVPRSSSSSYQTTPVVQGCTSIPQTPQFVQGRPSIPQTPQFVQGRPSAPPIQLNISSNESHNPFQSHTRDPYTFNQLYGTPMRTGVFTEKNYHNINGEWSH